MKQSTLIVPTVLASIAAAQTTTTEDFTAKATYAAFTKAPLPSSVTASLNYNTTYLSTSSYVEPTSVWQTASHSEHRNISSYDPSSAPYSYGNSSYNSSSYGTSGYGNSSYNSTSSAHTNGTAILPNFSSSNNSSAPANVSAPVLKPSTSTAISTVKIISTDPYVLKSPTTSSSSLSSTSSASSLSSTALKSSSSFTSSSSILSTTFTTSSTSSTSSTTSTPSTTSTTSSTSTTSTTSTTSSTSTTSTSSTPAWDTFAAPTQETGVYGYLLDESDSNLLLNLHNEVRSQHVDTPDLIWNNTLVELAYRYMSYLEDENPEYSPCSGNLLHSDGSWRPSIGENLAAGTGVNNLEGLFNLWADEGEYYNYTSPALYGGPNNIELGHFTQLVWKDSSAVGCGTKVCTEDDGSYWTYLICEYYTEGNILVEGPGVTNEFELFLENVLPLKA